MAEWKKEIRRLAKDFNISTFDLQRIFRRVEGSCMQKEMPKYYKGDRNEFLYDNAQREIMKLIFA